MPDSLSPAAVPASTASSDLESLLAKMGQQAKSAEGEAATERSEAQARIDEARAQLHQLDDSAAAMKPPDFKEAPPAPPPVQTNPWQTFGSPAMILAALGGFLTQRPLITSLNAGAKVMQATAQGDVAESQRQMEIWKIAAENASRANDFELRQYTAAIEKLGTDRADARAELTAAFSAMGNASKLELLAMNDDKIILDALLDQKNRGDDLKKSIPLAQAYVAFMQAKIAENGGKPLTSQQNLDALKEFQSAAASGSTGLTITKLQAISAEKHAQLETMQESDPNKATLMAEVEALDKGIEDAKRTGSIGGMMERLYAGRVGVASSEVLRDLANVVNMPITASTGPFGIGREQGPSILDATKETLATAMSGEDAQMYNTMISGLARELASIESVGMRPPVSFSNQIGGLAFSAGDTNLAKLTKLAQARQIVEAGIEFELTDPNLPKEMKDKMQEYSDKVKDIIPWTVSDVIKLRANSNQEATIRQIATASKPTDNDISYLRANDSEEMRKAFDAHFGVGAAKKALGE